MSEIEKASSSLLQTMEASRGEEKAHLKLKSHHLMREATSKKNRDVFYPYCLVV